MDRNFSITINGQDLRATIINTLVKEGVEGPTDPATLADEIMLDLGFESGYDINGDYNPGYLDYMKKVGLHG